VFAGQLYTKDGKLAVKTVKAIPDVDQTFGGTFSPSSPAPGRTAPGCAKRDLPWVGKGQTVKVVGG
jgi:branched-chain amino acid transport system substrate-binding protein